MSKKWRTLSSDEVYKTPWIRVRRDEVLNHNGIQLTYSVVELNNPSVFIVAINQKNEILLQRTYRYTLNKTIWQIPAGHSDGDDPLKAAQRELREEAGLASDDWVHLSRLYQAIGIGNVPFDLFLARHAYSVSDERDELEEIPAQKFINLEAIEDLIRKGEFEDTPLLAAIYLAKLHGL